ncbi:hypothetical protein GEMRC1_010061 [Eukaryota sp. GEM-RC1]
MSPVIKRTKQDSDDTFLDFSEDCFEGCTEGLELQSPNFSKSSLEGFVESTVYFFYGVAKNARDFYKIEDITLYFRQDIEVKSPRGSKKVQQLQHITVDEFVCFAKNYFLEEAQKQQIQLFNYENLLISKKSTSDTRDWKPLKDAQLRTWLNNGIEWLIFKWL